MRKEIHQRIRRKEGGVDFVADVNAVVSVNEGQGKEREMADQSEPEELREVSHEELDELAGEELPERAAMSLVNANVAIPINAAVAANVLSDDAVAYANAEQDTPIDQST